MSTLLISEQDKLNILKQYGLLAEQDGFRFNKPGDKNYTPPTGPYAPPGEIEIPSSEEEFYEPTITIPGVGIKMSFIDITSLVLSVIPTPYTIGAAVLLDISSVFYFIKTDDEYEAGLRAMFLFLPLNDLPFIRRIGKKAFIALLKKLRDISKNLSAIKKLNKQDVETILSLAKEFSMTGKNISQKFKLALRRMTLFIKLMKFASTSALNVKDFLYKLWQYNKSNPKSFGAISKQLLYVLTKLLAKLGIIITTWDSLWSMFASDRDKFQKELNALGKKSMSSISADNKFEVFYEISKDINLSNYILKQS